VLNDRVEFIIREVRSLLLQKVQAFIGESSFSGPRQRRDKVEWMLC